MHVAFGPIYARKMNYVRVQFLEIKVGVWRCKVLGEINENEMIIQMF